MTDTDKTTTEAVSAAEADAIRDTVVEAINSALSRAPRSGQISNITVNVGGRDYRIAVVQE